jgi:large subunit ribosomal protein L21
MKYAIVESGGKQYKAVEGGTLEVDRLPVEAGASVKLEQVLLLADGENVTVGSPIVKDSPVWTKVIEHFKGEKVTIFNYSPKKRIRVKTGHRQNYTRLLVQQIGGAKLVAKEPEPKVAKAERAEEPKAVKAETKALSTKAKAEAKPTAKAPSSKGKAKAKPTAKKAEVKKTEVKSASKATSQKGKPESKPATKTSSPKGKTPTKPAAKKSESK